MKSKNKKDLLHKKWFLNEQFFPLGIKYTCSSAEIIEQDLIIHLSCQTECKTTKNTGKTEIRSLFALSHSKCLLLIIVYFLHH
jgi:hypothetical protein